MRATCLGLDAYLATGRLKHGEEPVPVRGRMPRDLSLKDWMARRLRIKKGRAVYARRKAVAEAPFGQIKQVRGFRQLLLRGLAKARGEWALICLTHNLLKLYRATVAA
uniref:transposase n=1 Tax=Stigmatella ashevillensis TaxID=2995309 RepID=UPI00358DCE10